MKTISPSLSAARGETTAGLGRGETIGEVTGGGSAVAGIGAGELEEEGTVRLGMDKLREGGEVASCAALCFVGSCCCCCNASWSCNCEAKDNCTECSLLLLVVVDSVWRLSLLLREPFSFCSGCASCVSRSLWTV